MTKQVYALNVSGTTLQLKHGYVEIRRGAFRKLSEDEQAHPDFKYAVEKGWITLSDTEPDVTDAQPSIDPVLQHEPYRGMTSEELKQEQAKPVAPKATSENIGVKKEEEAEKTATDDPVVTEVTVEETPAEETPKAGRGRSKNA